MKYFDLLYACIHDKRKVFSISGSDLFCIDFSTHVCHAFVQAKGTDRKTRTAHSIDVAGGAVFNGAMSTIIGISTLSLSSSQIFISFFKVMFLVMIFGANTGRSYPFNISLIRSIKSDCLLDVFRLLDKTCNLDADIESNVSSITTSFIYKCPSFVMRKVFNPARNEASEVELKYVDLLYACIGDRS
jgi:hypothetical protein